MAVFEGMGMVLSKRRESASKKLQDLHLWYQLVHLAAVGRDLTLIYVSKHATSHAFGRRMQLDLVISQTNPLKEDRQIH